MHVFLYILFLIKEDDVRFPLRMLLAVLLIVPACNRNEPRSTQAAPEERANAEEQIKNERDAYVKSIDARLAEIDKNLDGLDERGNAMSGATKTNFKNAIDGLRDQKKSVASKLDDLKKVNVESWTTLRGEVDSALADLNQSYNRVSDTYPPRAAAPKPKTS
jgi:DNA repair exonuclease SbcCD ATPase subunit